MIKILFISAPPRAGKDSFCNVFCNLGVYENVICDRFAESLYQTIPRIFQIDPSEWEWIYENEKSSPSHLLCGMTPREAMIWVSEDVIKPKFGKDFFGLKTVDRLKKTLYMQQQEDHIVLINGLGFYEEGKAVVDWIGANNCYHLSISKKGCNYSNDSRRPVSPAMLGISDDHIFKIDNNSSLENLSQKAKEIYKSIDFTK